MNKINNKLRYFKSAVAFFFLFFLHGFSIGNGQQGISYNNCVQRMVLCEGGASMYKSSNLAQCLIVVVQMFK